MKRKLSTPELTGLILLCLLFVGITVAAVSLRSCGNASESAEIKTVIVEEADSRKDVPVNKKENVRKKKVTQDKKDKKKKRKQNKRGTASTVPERDPFKDTIPLY